MANTFELISAVTVGSGGASSIDFTSIPSTWTDLCLKLSLRNSGTGVGAWQDLLIKFNSATTTYTQRYIYGTGSSAASNSGGYATAGYGGNTPPNDITASTFGNIDIYIPNAASSNQKSFSVDSVTENNASSALALLNAGLWNGTSAITSINLTSQVGGQTFVQHSTAYLYGVKNA